MQNSYDYRRYAILYVDDEEKSLKYFRRAFESKFRIFTASNVEAGIRVLEQNKDEIGLLMTDQRMPGAKGVSLLEHVRQSSPRVVRILATAYSDMDAVVAAVNTGAIYRYVTKPWEPDQLEAVLKRGLEFFIVQKERDQLLNEKMSVLHNMMVADRIMSLGLLSAGMSHHIRNALVSVKTFLDLLPGNLQQETDNGPALKNPEFWNDYYQGVQGQVEKIQNLLSDLWSAAEKPALGFSDVVHLHEIIAEVRDRLRRQLAEKKNTLQNQIPTTLPPLTVDRAKFSRLFELLLRDEIASLPAGSQVRLEARPLSSRSGPDAEIEVEISDNGPGLTEDALRLIFDPFVARSDSPSEYGINLMACYFIVHYHGGRVAARSHDGQGTTFSLRLRTNSAFPQHSPEQTEFSQKVVLNQTLWERLHHTAEQ